MKDFKMRFAQYNAATGEYAFSNVRNGLIVGLVCCHLLDRIQPFKILTGLL